MTPAAHTEHAHAKINLLLRILAREASGYHAIETLFQRLALHDVVQVSVNQGPSTLHCDGPAMPIAGLGAATDNLAWRAAAAYARTAPWLASWQIHIEKHIPVGGGLGGGSADAAAVLRALDALAPTPLGLERLLDIAGTLGADVPFLTAPDALAWAWARGDRLLALPALPPMAVTLVTFAHGVNTGAAYTAVAAQRASGGAVATTAPLSARRYGASAFTSWQAIAALTGNDFEDVVPALHDGVAAVLPAVKQVAEALRAAGHPAVGLMSGSGATCFVLHPPDVEITIPLPPGSRTVRTTTIAAPTGD